MKKTHRDSWLYGGMWGPEKLFFFFRVVCVAQQGEFGKAAAPRCGAAQTGAQGVDLRPVGEQWDTPDKKEWCGLTTGTHGVRLSRKNLHRQDHREVIR